MKCILFLKEFVLSDFIDLIAKKKWDLLIILVLLVLVSILGPLAVGRAISSTIQLELAPTIDRIDRIEKSFENLEKVTYAEITEKGVAAYKKFEGLTGQELIERLESSTQNTASAAVALRIPEVKNILFQFDRELTIELCDYFQIE